MANRTFSPAGVCALSQSRASSREGVPVIGRLHAQRVAPGQSADDRAVIRERHRHHQRDADRSLQPARRRRAPCPSARTARQPTPRPGRPPGQHAERRQELPDAVVPGRVRQGPEQPAGTPSARPTSSPNGSDPPPPRCPRRPRQRRARGNPTGVTNTVQTSVLYQGSEPSGVEMTWPRNSVLIRIVSAAVRFDAKNRVDAADRLGPPGRVEQRRATPARPTPADQQASSRPRRLAIETAQTRNGNGRNQPVSLVSAAQPSEEAEDDHPAPIADARSGRRPAVRRRRRRRGSQRPRATRAGRRRWRSGRGRRGSAGRPRPRRRAPPARCPSAGRRTRRAPRRQAEDAGSARAGRAAGPAARA